MDKNGAFFAEVEPSQRLKGLILARVALARRRTARFRVAASGLGVFVSAGFLVPAISYALQEFYASGFYEYFSLFFSDTSVATFYWREILLSLTESLPSLAVLLLLGLSVALLWSLRGMWRDIRVATAPIQIA